MHFQQNPDTIWSKFYFDPSDPYSIVPSHVQNQSSLLILKIFQVLSRYNHRLS